jgi:hypothetical protein
MRGLNWQPAWDRRHPKAAIRIRTASGMWLVALSAILFGYGRWWGALLLPPAALHLWLARQLRRSTRT